MAIHIGRSDQQGVACIATKERQRTTSGRIRTFLTASVTAFMPVGASAGDVALGEYLSSECVTCHQISGHGTGGIPPIVGLAQTHFVEALEAYKSGERDNEVMQTIAGRLTAEDISALAAYFAEQGPKH